MAHFAQLNESNVVTQVIVVSNDAIGNLPFPESNVAGQEFLRPFYGSNWQQTSYNGSFRKNYAGIGYTFDPVLDAFIPPQPFPSWVLNVQTCQWEAPVPMPTDGMYYWDEQTLSWVKVQE